MVNANCNRADVAIGIIAYNAERYIADTIHSLRVQTFSKWTAVVLVNGSTDDTEQVAREAVRGDNRIRVDVTDAKLGAPGARNKLEQLLPSATYRYWLDADDLIAPTMLNTMVNYLDLHHDAWGVYARPEVINANNELWPEPLWHKAYVPTRFWSTENRNMITPLSVLFDHTGIGPSWTLMRSDVAERMGEWDPTVSADTDMWIRMSLSGDKALHELRPDAPLVSYRVHDQQVTGDGRHMDRIIVALEAKWRFAARHDPDPVRCSSLTAAFWVYDHRIMVRRRWSTAVVQWRRQKYWLAARMFVAGVRRYRIIPPKHIRGAGELAGAPWPLA